MSAPRNPKASMKSTWRQDKSQWSIPHKIFEHLNIYPVHLDREVPVHAKTDKVPFVSAWQVHRWILFYAWLPLVTHQLLVSMTTYQFHPAIAFIYYLQMTRLFISREVRTFRDLSHKYGFFDGDQHERDGVPDARVGKVLLSVILGGLLRPLMIICLAYDRTKGPISVSWKWVVVEISLYGVVVDFWFYLYHRLMHEVDGLWKYHRTHHLTRHPNMLLTIYADSVQESFDIVGIPLMAYVTMKHMGLPMGFYEWHLAQLYVLFAEILGHSGLRVHAQGPNPMALLLRAFEMDLTIEDHDLHHRKGWRKGHNYGKQTRIWDRIFGTCAERIESVESNVDYKNQATMPLF
ncbi:hypothetical protein N7454_008013 [Penicillium verhagenii]|nr:hypothetical protein N7454_008013 [Penicillium verhagenii]